MNNGIDTAMKIAKWITAIAAAITVYWGASNGRWDVVLLTLPVVAVVGFAYGIVFAIIKRIRGPKSQPPVSGFSVDVTPKDKTD